MGGKPYQRRLTASGPRLLVSSAFFPAHAPVVVAQVVFITILLLIEKSSVSPLAVVFLSPLFYAFAKTSISVGFDRIKINEGAVKPAKACELSLSEALTVEERIDKNPVFNGRIGTYVEGQYATLHGMGTSRHLTPRGVLVLAELKRLGAKVTFPGFGGKGEQNEEEQHNLSDRLHRIEALVAFFPVLFIIVAFSFEITGNLPWFTPWHYLLGFIPWLIYSVLYIGSSLLEKKTYAKTTKERIEICLQGRLKREIPWDEIKQILITVHPTKFWFESVSVHIVTHYNRTHTLMNRELTLVRGALDIIDLARSKGIGVKVVYQDAADEEEVFLDIKHEEKPLPREQITPAAELNQDVVERA
jgi:hypothetical protein